MSMVTVGGDFGHADSGVAEGRVWFAPHLDAVHADPDPVLVTRARIETELDAAGTFSVDLYASDDPAWQTSAPVPYLVRWAVSGSYAERVVLILGPGPHDLWSLVDVGDPPAIVPTPVPGPPGAQGEVAVGSTVTGPPGSDAAVTDSDPSPHKAVLEFVIPRGDVGAQGDIGPQGPQGEVAVDSTVTGAPGTSALVEDLDPSAHKALLRFTIPRGDVGPAGPAIGGVLTTKGDLAARDASTVVRLPVGSNGLALVADSTQSTGLRYGSPGWESVTLWADLPASGNWAGRRIRVTSGLGLCVALWTGTTWVVGPESDTGIRTLTMANGWAFSVSAPTIRRIGLTVHLVLPYRVDSSAATTDNPFSAFPVGWRVGTPNTTANGWVNTAAGSAGGTTPSAGTPRAIYSDTSGNVGIIRTPASAVISGDHSWQAHDTIWPTTAP